MVKPAQLDQQNYWRNLKLFLEEQNSIVSITKPLPQNYINLPIGKSGICLAVAVNSQTSELYIWLLFYGKDSKVNYDRLKRIAYDQSLIEVSKDLVWDRMEKNIRSAVKLTKNADYMNKQDWGDQFQWFKVHLEKYYIFFNPLITNI